MSDTKEPEVLQGRLGWESGDISEADPTNLEPHPKNEEIYGDTESADDLDQVFLDSVAEKGVLEPLVITQGKKIVSGHRRWLAAKAADLDRVPVRYSEFDGDLVEREALIEFNRQREKTDGQILNEALELLEIERQRGREEMAKEGKTGREGSSGRTNLPGKDGRDDSHDSWEEVADVVGASSTGLKRGAKVKEKAKSQDAPEPVRETAKEQWDKLQSGESTFYTAAKQVEKAEAEQAVENQEDQETRHPAIVREKDATTFLESVEDPDLVIADPPYSTDVDDTESFARQWVGPMVDAIGDDGLAFVFIGAYSGELRAYLNVLAEYGVLDRTDVLVWTYRNTLGQSPNETYKRNWQAILFIQSDPAVELDAPKTSERWAVQDINAPDGRFGDRYHEWQKPSEIVRRFIRHTTAEDDLVVDPFVGTGTTVLEAADLGRRAIGSDIDPDMLDIATDRGCQKQ